MYVSSPHPQQPQAQAPSQSPGPQYADQDHQQQPQQYPHMPPQPGYYQHPTPQSPYHQMYAGMGPSPMQPFNYPPQHQFQPQAQPYQQMAGYHYYYDPSTMLPPPTPASAPHAPHQHPQHQPFHPFPPGPPPAQVRPTKPPITRSPRPANGSGGRMQNFVFPLPPGSGSKQSPHVPQPSTTSSLGSGSTHGSAGPGVTSLPPKPNFEPSGGLETSRDASSAMLNTATPMASTSSVGSVLPRDPSRTSGRTELGKEVLEHLPPLPPLVPEPSKRPAKEQQSEEMSAYVESVLASLASYKLREDAMQQRIEALAFRPAQAWRALSQQRQNTDGTTEAAVPDDADHDDISSITGVRLLTKVVQLQAENDELGSLLESKLQTIQSGTGDSRLQQELQDAHHLIDKLSTALTLAQEKAANAQRALHAAVDSKSVGFS